MSAKANGSMVVTREFRVTNKLGIHAWPAARFVKTANQFDCASSWRETARRSAAEASWA